MDCDKIIKRFIEVTEFKNEKEVAELFGDSPQNFSNKKRKGTLLPKIIEKTQEINPDINLDWLVNGKGEIYLNTEKNGENLDQSNWEKNYWKQVEYNNRLLDRIEKLEAQIEILRNDPTTAPEKKNL